MLTIPFTDTLGFNTVLHYLFYIRLKYVMKTIIIKHYYYNLYLSLNKLGFVYKCRQQITNNGLILQINYNISQMVKYCVYYGGNLFDNR